MGTLDADPLIAPEGVFDGSHGRRRTGVA